MENMIMERTRVPETLELSACDPEALVSECISDDTSEADVYQKLMSAIARVTEEISRLDAAEASKLVSQLSKAAKGLRKNTADHNAFRFFYFGEFQTHVNTLEQRLERNRSELQIQLAASKKHFAPIMQFLYINQTCQHKELSNKLGIDKSNLSREMQCLVDSGLVDSQMIGKFKYYSLTPQGRGYYDNYLLMKAQLEEQIYAPSQEPASLGTDDFSHGILPEPPKSTYDIFEDSPWEVKKPTYIFSCQVYSDSQNKNENLLFQEVHNDDEWQ
mgnify:CR=1 FL=1